MPLLGPDMDVIDDPKRVVLPLEALDLAPAQALAELGFELYVEPGSCSCGDPDCEGAVSEQAICAGLFDLWPYGGPRWLADRLRSVARGYAEAASRALWAGAYRGRQADLRAVVRFQERHGTRRLAYGTGPGPDAVVGREAARALLGIKDPEAVAYFQCRVAAELLARFPGDAPADRWCLSALSASVLRAQVEQVSIVEVVARDTLDVCMTLSWKPGALAVIGDA